MIEVNCLGASASLARTEPSTRAPLWVGVVQHRWHALEAAGIGPSDSSVRYGRLAEPAHPSTPPSAGNVAAQPRTVAA